MTMRLAVIVAVILVATGVGVVYMASLVADMIRPDVPRLLSFLLWHFVTIIGFVMILVGLLTFYGTYLTNRNGMKRGHSDKD